ncbi:hypothetical protein [Trinickia sp.]|uniref:hypothetical protein n=1 Tax=Trinickia sp. TaxID=2571163 RepID=UPI003F81DDE0
MYISSDAPTLASCDAFAAWARITVKYDDSASAMPLARLDRRGLTVAANAAAPADWPAIGLPRRAQIIADSTSLCELRLVARTAIPCAGRTVEVTLQPSRADDDALLWQALRADQIHLGTVPLEQEMGQLANPSAVATASPRRRDGAAGRAAGTETAAREHRAVRLAASTIEWCGPVSCDVAFTLASREDAWFFSRWLDYHFAEVRAWARMNDAAADLREMFMRVVEHEVEVRFVFQAAERIVRASTETACRCIAAEAAHGLGVTVEYWLASTPTALPGGSRHRAVVSSYADTHSFSSKQ